MKRLVFTAFLAVATCASLPAQQAGILSAGLAAPSPRFAAGAPDSDSYLFPGLAVPAPQPALPNAPVPPQTGNLGDIETRWDLSATFAYVHFKSAPFSANLFGLHTALAYKLNDFFALEGSLVSAFGGDVLGGERSKFVMYTGGGRVGWKLERRRWAPWAHALVGGAHVNPQTAAGSKNGFAFQAGGGADLRFNPHLSFRAEGDYIHTLLYSSSQNNFEFGAGVVIHF